MMVSVFVRKGVEAVWDNDRVPLEGTKNVYVYQCNVRKVYTTFKV